ncbi:Leucine-rich repeat protein kinase family protein, putative [Theobroma cacao]|uniref:Leucine-rich repeat protein kinase family protein, putative n=1 Tax=Theobroma cacao TaxID=3641 RepID=A0A061FFN4_THECC|nr:Leucine-rich repeat protein kinase family protein, putative [Theobroma cacao]
MASSIENKNIVEDSEDKALDVSGKAVEFSFFGNPEEKVGSSVEGLYLYNNDFNLIPEAVSQFGKLKFLKFFGNEINLLPSVVGNLAKLESLKMKISSPGLNGVSFRELSELKELELSRTPPQPSRLTALTEIAGIKGLTRLTLCYFSIRYLPSEIGCLTNLEFFDISFNNIKNLPAEISNLNELITLKVVHNKLMELPSSLSKLNKLENLDLSNNRLTSLRPLELEAMHRLKNLNVGYNKIMNCCQIHIPGWISCDLEGNKSNGKGLSVGVCESVEEKEVSVSSDCPRGNTSLEMLSQSGKSRFESQSLSSGKRWKRRQQDKLRNYKKLKSEGNGEDVLSSETGLQSELYVVDLNGDENDKGESENSFIGENAVVETLASEENCICLDHEAIKEGKKEYDEQDEISVSSQGKGSYSESFNSSCMSKRHSSCDLDDNPKTCKYQKPNDGNFSLSRKYNNTSFCSVKDRIPDGFYDAGRDRLFMSLESYERILHLDSREVILADREKDEQLDAITLSAQALISSWKKLNGLASNGEPTPMDNLQIASLLALFVSNRFGGSDRSFSIEKTRKAVSGSNYLKPFVCSCATGNNDCVNDSTEWNFGTIQDISIADLCDKSLCSTKSRLNSVVVPIGTMQFGVCRHRALLMKYLCDRMVPPVPCELVRGYLDFYPHAWNVVLVKKGDLLVRMVVDACHPDDIREEMDPEYFCRYIPLTRTKDFLSNECNLDPDCFPSLSTSEKIEKTPNVSLIKCSFGSVEAAAKVRTVNVLGTSMNEIRNFEYSCLGEIRMLGALKHSCIVELYGHQISSKWVPSAAERPEHRIIQSAILMEYVKGGSLKCQIEKLLKAGKKHFPLDFALCVAHDVACALAALHSKHIIHRDIKSHNILIDLDEKRADGTPIVKLCDFDRAVPLRSFLHKCCIAHTGIHPPNVCVGTPRWMAPEVLRTMQKPNLYGLEVDIWSYGCLIYELLTLQIPYFDFSDDQMHDFIQMGKRPPLTDELEALLLLDEFAISQELDRPKSEIESLRFLINVFHRCTVENPTDRPKAEELYEMFHAHASNLRSFEEV